MPEIAELPLEEVSAQREPVSSDLSSIMVRLRPENRLTDDALFRFC